MTEQIFIPIELSIPDDVELSGDNPLISGREFQGLSVGEFTSMGGHKVGFTPIDLAAYIENTRPNIAATTELQSGQVAGLPIDARGHDKGDGAGWITGLRLAPVVSIF